MSSRLFESLLFLFITGLLLVQNWNVYHATVVYNCNFVVLCGSVLLLSGRLLRAHVKAMRAHYPLEVPPEYVGTWALILAQLAGLSAWLARRLFQQTRAPKLAGLVGAPLAIWAIWRVLFRRWTAREGVLFGKEDSEGLGGESRRLMRMLMWQLALIVEQSVVCGYVVGLLPPAFASEFLFFDYWHCAIFAVSAALSTGAILSLWTLRSHLPRLHSLWCLLGAWKTVSSAAADAPPWDPHRSYPVGSIVTYGGTCWEATGPYHSNLARPGSPGAALLHFWLGGNALRVFDAVIVLQIGIVLYHICAAVSKAHYMADLAVALLNYPVILIFVHWRRTGIRQLTCDNK